MVRVPHAPGTDESTMGCEGERVTDPTSATMPCAWRPRNDCSAAVGLPPVMIQYSPTGPPPALNHWTCSVGACGSAPVLLGWKVAVPTRVQLARKLGRPPAL